MPIPSSPLAPAATGALDLAPRLVVRQQKSMLEVFTDFEARNRYAVYTEAGQFVGGFAEQGSGIGAFLSRWMLESRRPFTMGFYAAEAPSVASLLLERPWRWWMARVEVRDARTGRPLGALQQRFSLIRKRLDLESPDGRVLARLSGPFWRPWTLLLQVGPEERPREVGRIEKKWSGFLQEAFTVADDFLVTLPSGDRTLRLLTLAAAVAVDFLWFERRD